MKTLQQYEAELKQRAFKSHDLVLEPDVVSIETALLLIQEAAEQAIDRYQQKVDGMLMPPEIKRKLEETTNNVKSELK